jgi:hypothetical protein
MIPSKSCRLSGEKTKNSQTGLLVGIQQPICWGLNMSKNNFSLTLIYQPEDSSFISKNIEKVYEESSQRLKSCSERKYEFINNQVPQTFIKDSRN